MRAPLQSSADLFGGMVPWHLPKLNYVFCAYAGEGLRERDREREREKQSRQFNVIASMRTNPGLARPNSKIFPFADLMHGSKRGKGMHLRQNFYERLKRTLFLSVDKIIYIRVKKEGFGRHRFERYCGEKL